MNLSEDLLYVSFANWRLAFKLKWLVEIGQYGKFDFVLSFLF